MENKLNAFNKILLATGTINYMASALEGVRKDYSVIATMNEKKEIKNEFSDKVITDGLSDKEQMLDSVVKKLCDLIEDFGNYLDGNDIVCPIDERVYKAPLEILLHGMDEEETDYDDLISNEPQ